MHGLYSSFTQSVHKLIDQLLEESRISVHSISSRTKEEGKIREKIGREVNKYNKLSDITDISGVRIITYFEDGVDEVAKIVEREFQIDTENCTDKRSALDPDRFGYLSLHYVAWFSKARLALTEYKRFADCKVEIQIRSILQHAWAEIEHDLGYKSKQAIPRDVRRSFSRLAGATGISGPRIPEGS
jgi:ppGpp synthetase/RelA/SpoT-type nucleotidyltranferase